MGVIGDSLDDIFARVGGFISFVIIYTILVFVLGEWYALSVRGDLLWYPIYALGIALFFKILIDVGRGGKKAEKK